MCTRQAFVCSSVLLTKKSSSDHLSLRAVLLFKERDGYIGSHLQLYIKVAAMSNPFLLHI